MSSTPGEVRPVLGQQVDIGCLYNGHTDSFLPIKLITADIPGKFVNFSQVSERHVRTSTEDSIVEKFKQLGISHELGASFLTGLVPVSGVACYLESLRESNRTMEGAIYFDISREKLELNLKNGGINKHLSREAAQCKNSTHIVTGVTFGTRIIISVRVPFQDDKESTKKRLSTALDQLKAYLISHLASNYKANKPVEKDEASRAAVTLKDSFSDLSFGFFSDITGMERFQNISIHEIVQSIQGLPRQLRRTSKPIFCKLVAVANASMVVDIRYSPFQQVTQVPDDILQELFGISAAWTATNGKLCDLFNDMKSSGHGLRVENMALQTSYEEYLEGLKDRRVPKWRNCKTALVGIRRGSCSPEELRQMILNVQTEDDSPQELSSMINQAFEKFEFQKRILSEDGKYLDYAGAQRAISTGSNVYVFYFKNAMKQDKDSWEANRNILFNLLKRNSGDYLVVAAECGTEDVAFARPRVSFYSRCEVVIEDMSEALDFADQCWARYESKHLDTSQHPPPTDRRLVRISCPLASCGTGARDWNCYKCRIPLEYYEGHIYCNCGRANAENYAWQCNSDDHGKEFVNCRARALKSRLEKLHSYKDLNILILGETGVGKSTWINAFYNYMMFQTLDEAMAHSKLEYVIPSSFSMQYVDRTNARPRFVQTNVRVGEFNEAEADGMTGDSGTQQSRVYRISVGSTVVRLIDTPGVGDVRGIEADRKNLSSILQTLNRVSSLHGIVILLKPNAARLNLMFRFCVKELLTYLHRDAASNIVWGFTNTRQSNYMPGDSFQPLQRLLQEHQSLGLTISPETVFCFDSESFRCLAAKKQAEFMMPNQDDFRQSWERSAKETHRLLDYFASLEPHLVQSTLSLNRSREIISQLTMPIADIVDVIERTIKLNQEEIDDLKSAKGHTQVLEKSLRYSRIDIEVAQLPLPRTVCKNPACVELIDVGGVRRPKYNSICHDGCRLRKVDEEVVGHPNLNHCRAFGRMTFCRRDNCKHHWQEHMHIRFSQTEKVTQVTDSEVQAKIDGQVSTIQIREQGVRSRRAKIAGFEAELEKIRNAAARFGLFLKKNSIVPYNDAMIRYLDELVKDERQTIAFHRAENTTTEKNEARLQDLEKSRRQYQERIKMLEEQVEGSDDATLLDEQGVEELVKELYALPTWGQNLQVMQNAIEWSKAAEFHEEVLRPKINRGVLDSIVWAGTQVYSAAKRLGSAGRRQSRTAQSSGSAETSASLGSKRWNSNSTQDGPRRKSRRLEGTAPFSLTR
ncbi:hypothetical protein F4820DRAFT_419342 [Hypoxylon rubiginosum]|uniref:Uncharacterized protein n=1 Tax=Hypoxylon rubiginosum TaxID=110542 RepID=A0ACB9Z1X3_9PEZI|nr:hypothetical protein F4820DRAFT_419342 [Hypoxylon rubiginosum]